MIYGRHDIEAYFIIVGFGSAGAASAISAQANGADVLILEKCHRLLRGHLVCYL